MANTKKKASPTEKEEYKCCRCGKVYTRQVGNFSASQSKLFEGNNSRLPVCDKCVDEIWNEYMEIFGGNEKKTLRYMCMKFDIYYNESCLEAAKKVASTRSLIKSYISKTNLIQYKGKTYDTTLREAKDNIIISSNEELAEDDDEISEEVIMRWGYGFSPQELKFLEDRLETWKKDNKCETTAELSVFKTICLSELNLQRAMNSGSGDPDKAMSSYNKLLETAKVQPKQSKDIEDELNSNEKYCIGTIIENWEKEKPVPEKKKYKDVYGIGKYINTWFYGHMAKMLGIKNDSAEDYEKEINKYTVSRNEEDFDDNAEEFDKLFGDTDKADEGDKP